MGMLNPNTLVGILNGKIGDLVFVRTQDGRPPLQFPQAAVGEYTH